MFPFEFCGEVNREETRVMGLSSSEDRMIVAGIALMNTSQNPPGVSCLVHSGHVAKQHDYMSLLFCMISVRGGCSVIRLTSRLETRWYQRISRILLRHH